MAQSFSLLDEEFGLPELRAPFEVVQVCLSIGDAPQFHLDMEADGWRVRITFDDPISHRAQDERDLLAYWMARGDEGAPVGAAYEIGQSAYLDEMSRSPSGAAAQLRHYLFAGCDLCVEVIATERPQVVIRRVS